MPFAQLGLQAELLRAIAAQGYTFPTPIQAQAVPVVLEGRDVLAGAQTGTGNPPGQPVHGSGSTPVRAERLSCRPPVVAVR